MTSAATMQGAHWFVRGAKPVSFELPPSEAEIEVDISDFVSMDAEVDYALDDRTLKKGFFDSYTSSEAPGAASEEIDPNDVLAEFPADPEEPFELRVPHAILARAALLKATLPRETFVTPKPRTPGRWGWFVAAAVGAFVGLLLTGGLAYRLEAPIASGPAPHLRGAHVAKVLARHLTAIDATVPTVPFDSLPHAR